MEIDLREQLEWCTLCIERESSTPCGSDSISYSRLNGR